MFGRQKTAILSILLGCTSAIADNYPKNPDIDIINYTFQIVLSDNVDVIDVEATIDFIFRKKGNPSSRSCKSGTPYSLHKNQGCPSQFLLRHATRYYPESDHSRGCGFAGLPEFVEVILNVSTTEKARIKEK